MNKEMYYSLLDDPVITIRSRDGRRSKTNLPNILFKLMDNTIASFEALQPHQQQAWYSFLVQLSTMAVARHNNEEIPTEPMRWRKILIDLAGGSEAAWHLVVEDESEPAFMQSPVPEGTLEDAKYISDLHTPDNLDMLVTSKNHDVKGSRIVRPEPEHWLFALLNLQSMEGFLGRGNYGIARMNGGFGNRPLVGISTGKSWGVRFERDMKVLLANRSSLFEMYSPQGFTLLWLPTWNGEKKDAIPIWDCDPYFIEICRRVRFKLSNEQIQCYRANTNAARVITPDDLNGRTEDPWTPIEKKDLKALTLGESGFTYELIQQLLLGEEYIQPAALTFQNNEQGETFLICQALVRGQGKTDGLHRRIMQIPPNASSILFRRRSDKELLAKRARKRVSLIHDVQRKMIRPAISMLLSGGTDQRVEYDKVAHWINRYDAEIDHLFFDSLWASIDLEPEEAKKQWEEILLQEAKTLFNEAQRSTPIPQLRRLRALSHAISIFYGQAYKVFEYAGKNNIPTTINEN